MQGCVLEDCERGPAITMIRLRDYLVVIYAVVFNESRRVTAMTRDHHGEIRIHSLNRFCTLEVVDDS